MKNYLYETAVLLCLALLPGSGASAQERSALRTAGPRFAVRTNALYWATASLNAGFEVGLDPRTSWEVAGGYNPWTFGDNRKLKFWTAQTEFRYWLRRRFAGHFFGLHVLYADYNAGGVKLFGMGDRRYEGFLYGTGLSYGYQSAGDGTSRRCWAWDTSGRNTTAMSGSAAGGFWAAAAGTISVRRGPACPSVS